MKCSWIGIIPIIVPSIQHPGARPVASKPFDRWRTPSNTDRQITPNGSNRSTVSCMSQATEFLLTCRNFYSGIVMQL